MALIAARIHTWRRSRRRSVTTLGIAAGRLYERASFRISALRIDVNSGSLKQRSHISIVFEERMQDAPSTKPAFTICPPLPLSIDHIILLLFCCVLLDFALVSLFARLMLTGESRPQSVLQRHSETCIEIRLILEEDCSRSGLLLTGGARRARSSTNESVLQSEPLAIVVSNADVFVMPAKLNASI